MLKNKKLKKISLICGALVIILIIFNVFIANNKNIKPSENNTLLSNNASNQEDKNKTEQNDLNNQREANINLTENQINNQTNIYNNKVDENIYNKNSITEEIKNSEILENNETNSPIIKLDDSQLIYSELTKQYGLDKKVENIKLKIEDESEILTIKYSVEVGNAVLKQNEMKGSNNPILTDLGFLMGKNKLVVTAIDKYKNQTTETFDMLNISLENENNIYLDKNDNDGDSLLNYQEDIIGTDKNSLDTDNDGLSDYDELTITSTNPLIWDTDNNGLNDGQEDFDNDGLTNVQEIEYKGNPYLQDTDLDGLTDSQEVIYQTKLNEIDTDNDGLTDKQEIDLGMTSPINPDSNGNGILDGKEKTDIEKQPEENKLDTNLIPTLTAKIPLEELSKIEIKKVQDDIRYTPKEMPGYIGSSYEIDGIESLENAILTFEYPEYLNENPNFMPAVYKIDPINQEITEMMSSKNISRSNQISVAINMTGVYIVLDKFKYEQSFSQEILPPSDGDSNKPLEVVFALDSSGSMATNDPSRNRVEVSKRLIDRLREKDKVGSLDFADWSNNITELTSDFDLVKNNLDKTSANGGTNIGRAVRTAIDIFDRSEERNAMKFIILLTDGEGSYDNELTEEAAQKGITIYTVGLGGSYNLQLLTEMAVKTGGKFYPFATASDLYEEFDRIIEAIVDVNTDQDKDGLSDYHELRIRLYNGVMLATDIMSKDTDGDMLSDGEELVAQYKGDGTISHYKMRSHPLIADSDGDGIRDLMDKNPLSFDITDKIQSYVAGLAYTNLESSVGKTIGELMDTGMEFKSLDKEFANILRNFEVIYGDDSGVWEEIADFGFGAIALRMDNIGTKNSVIIGYRGTEDLIGIDGLTDLLSGITLNGPQAIHAQIFYENLSQKYYSNDFYVTGHSLGGRLAQDATRLILQKNIDNNNQNIKEPTKVTTFAALGYLKTNLVFISGKVVKKMDDILKNYYYKYDVTGDGFGESWAFSILGKTKKFDIAYDKNGNKIECWWDFTKLHGIELFHYDKRIS